MVLRRGWAVGIFWTSAGGVGTILLGVQDAGLVSGVRGSFCQRCGLEHGDLLPTLKEKLLTILHLV